MIVFFSILFLVILALGVFAGVSSILLPGNHPINVAHRRRCWLANHPGATRTPWDSSAE